MTDVLRAFMPTRARFAACKHHAFLLQIDVYACCDKPITSDPFSIWQSSRESGRVVSTATGSKRNRPAAPSFRRVLHRAAHAFRNRSNTLPLGVCRSRDSEDSARTGSSGALSFDPRFPALRCFSGQRNLRYGSGKGSNRIVLIVYSHRMGATDRSHKKVPWYFCV